MNVLRMVLKWIFKHLPKMKKKIMMREITHLKVKIDWMLTHFNNFVRKFQERGCPHPYPMPIYSDDYKVEDRRVIERYCK